MSSKSPLPHLSCLTSLWTSGHHISRVYLVLKSTTKNLAETERTGPPQSTYFSDVMKEQETLLPRIRLFIYTFIDFTMLSCTTYKIAFKSYICLCVSVLICQLFIYCHVKKGCSCTIIYLTIIDRTNKWKNKVLFFILIFYTSLSRVTINRKVAETQQLFG